MAKTETAISKAIGQQLDQLGIYNLRLNSGKVKVRGAWMHLCPEGTPDRFFLLDGRACFIEVKKPGEKPTPEQIECHETITRHGGVVVVVDDPHKVLELVEGLKKAFKRAAA